MLTRWQRTWRARVAAAVLVAASAGSTPGLSARRHTRARVEARKWNADDDQATQVDSTEIILRYPLEPARVEPPRGRRDRRPVQTRVSTRDGEEGELARRRKCAPDPHQANAARGTQRYIEAGYDRTMFRWQARRPARRGERCDGLPRSAAAARTRPSSGRVRTGARRSTRRYFELARDSKRATQMQEEQEEQKGRHALRPRTRVAGTKMEVVASEVVAVVDGGGRSAAAARRSCWTPRVTRAASRATSSRWKRDGTPVARRRDPGRGGAGRRRRGHVRGPGLHERRRARRAPESSEDAPENASPSRSRRPANHQAIEAPAGRVPPARRGSSCAACSRAAASNYWLQGAARAAAPTTSSRGPRAHGRGRRRGRRRGARRAGRRRDDGSVTRRAPRTRCRARRE